MVRFKSGILNPTVFQIKGLRPSCAKGAELSGAPDSSPDLRASRAKGAVKSGISPRDLVQYERTSGGVAPEMQRQNVPLQGIDL